MQIKAENFKVDAEAMERFANAHCEYQESKIAEDNAAEEVASSGNSALTAFFDGRKEPKL